MLPLGVAVGVWVGVEPAGELGVLLGVAEVDGGFVLVEVLGVCDGVVWGCVAVVVVLVVGAAGTVKDGRAIALVPCVPGSVAKDASEASAESELTEVVGAAADEVPPAEVAIPAPGVPAVAATLTCEDGFCGVAVAEMAEAWAGWLAAVVPRVTAMAAAATPTTPTELSSTPLVGCIDFSAG